MEFNRQNTRKVLGIVAFGVLLYWGLQNLSSLSDFFRFLVGLAAPFLIGACIAFILNVPLRLIERWVLRPNPKSKKPQLWKEKLRRPASIVLTLLAVIGLLALAMFLIVPELGNSLAMLKNSIPGFIKQAEQWITAISVRMPEIAGWLTKLELDWNQIGQTVLGFVQNGAGNLLNSTISVAASIFSGVFTFFLGFVFSIYLLMQKEKLARQCKKLLYAFFPSTVADRTISILTLSNRTFSSFLTGQCTEAVILGMLFFAVMSLFRFPYALMISVLVAVTALIPIFGAFIGCAVGAFVILIINPMQAFWFVVMFIILQQIEGNLIYPRVVGNSVGLPSLWVLVAVTVGGSTMGVVGMLIFIPLCSVLYTLLRETVGRRLAQRRISPEKWNGEQTPEEE